MPNLTTLANVKQWLNLENSNKSDALLNRLIPSTSAAILNWLSRRTLAKSPYTQYIDGNGGREIVFDFSPVLSVTSVSIDGNPIPASNKNGFFFAPWNGYLPGLGQSLVLTGGYRFANGLQNIILSYMSGYAVVNEAQPISGGMVTALQPMGAWCQDDGVTYATGIVMTKVAASPAVGQYTVDTLGNYGFNAADEGQTVLISYSFIPADIEQACIETIAERYTGKDRIGTISKTLAGQETVTYSQKDLNDYTTMILQPYKRVIW